jgi:hypothetical protein
MSVKALFLAMAACLLCACAQMTSVPPPPVSGTSLDCKGASCDVNVSVKCDDKVHLFCWIEVDYEWVVVPPGKKPVINWTVSTPGYSFWFNGIAFPSDSGFDCHPVGKTKFMCNDHHKEGKYKYTVTLIGLFVPPVFPLDPYVDNQ